MTEGVTVVATIFGWNFLLDWLAYRSRFVYRLLHPPSLLLVRNGHIQARNLRSELITRQDLLAQLREQGVGGRPEREEGLPGERWQSKRHSERPIRVVAAT